MKNVNGINRADMIFAMAKEYALNLKRENHQRKQRRKARLRKDDNLYRNRTDNTYACWAVQRSIDKYTAKVAYENGAKRN